MAFSVPPLVAAAKSEWGDPASRGQPPRPGLSGVMIVQRAERPSKAPAAIGRIATEASGTARLTGGDDAP